MESINAANGDKSKASRSNTVPIEPYRHATRSEAEQRLGIKEEKEKGVDISARYPGRKVS